MCRNPAFKAQGPLVERWTRNLIGLVQIALDWQPSETLSTQKDKNTKPKRLICLKPCCPCFRSQQSSCIIAFPRILVKQSPTKSFKNIIKHRSHPAYRNSFQVRSKKKKNPPQKKQVPENHQRVFLLLLVLHTPVSSNFFFSVPRFFALCEWPLRTQTGFRIIVCDSSNEMRRLYMKVSRRSFSSNTKRTVPSI